MKNILFLFLIVCQSAGSQTHTAAEMFCGVDFNYYRINHARLYDVLVNLTPGAKISLGKDWKVAGQLHVPIINDGFLDRYDMLRVNMAVLSKKWHSKTEKQYIKISGGFFNKERMGADIKWIYLINQWLMLNAQVGYTGHWALGYDFDGNKESEFGKDWKITGRIGASFWLDRWKTECRLSGGRYIYDDYGIELDIFRHFLHVSTGVYLQYHEGVPERFFMNKEWTQFHIGEHRVGAGFKVIVMLPPYKASRKKMVVRPASNFGFMWSAQQDYVTMDMYKTDPEENEREQPIDIPWGLGKEDF